MSGNRYRPLNQWYFSGYTAINETNDAADEIISQPDKHLLSQDQLFAAQGGFSTIGLAIGASALATLAVFAASPRIGSHFRNGQLTHLEWVTIGSSAFASYAGATWIGQRTFGNHQKVTNHWIAYTFVKSQNRFLGRTILTNKPTY